MWFCASYFSYNVWIDIWHIFFFEQDTQYYSREYRGAWPSYGWACYMGHRQHSHLAARARAHAHACRLHWFTRLVIHECGTRRFCHSAFAVFAINKMLRQDVSKEIYRFSWEINFVNKKSIIYIYITYLIFLFVCKFQICTQTEWYSSRLNTKTCLFFPFIWKLYIFFACCEKKAATVTFASHQDWKYIDSQQISENMIVTGN